MEGAKEYLEQMQQMFAQKMIEFENGNMSCLEVLTDFENLRKPLEDNLKLIKDFKDQNINTIQNDAMSYPTGYNGYEISVRNGGRIFNYKNIEEWQTYEKNKKDCEERHKQAFISKEKGMLVASEDGEEMELPEVSYRKSSVVMKKI